MEVNEFIEENREELIKAIRPFCDNCQLEDNDIKEWIDNDEGLYYWALSAGVEL